MQFVRAARLTYIMNKTEECLEGFTVYRAPRIRFPFESFQCFKQAEKTDSTAPLTICINPSSCVHELIAKNFDNCECKNKLELF